MSELTTTQPKPRKAAKYKAAIDNLFGEMDRLNVQIEQEQARIQRLKAETRVISAETAFVKSRLDARLDALETMV